MKEQSISAIFSIQSERDFKKHGISQHYFNLLCDEHSIKFKSYSIEDMNNHDFIKKAEGGVNILS